MSSVSNHQFEDLDMPPSMTPTDEEPSSSGSGCPNDHAGHTVTSATDLEASHAPTAGLLPNAGLNAGIVHEAERGGIYPEARTPEQEHQRRVIDEASSWPVFSASSLAIDTCTTRPAYSARADDALRASDKQASPSSCSPASGKSLPSLERDGDLHNSDSSSSRPASPFPHLTWPDNAAANVGAHLLADSPLLFPLDDLDLDFPSPLIFDGEDNIGDYFDEFDAARRPRANL